VTILTTEFSIRTLSKIILHAIVLTQMTLRDGLFVTILTTVLAVRTHTTVRRHVVVVTILTVVNMLTMASNTTILTIRSFVSITIKVIFVTLDTTGIIVVKAIIAHRSVADVITVIIETIRFTVITVKEQITVATFTIGFTVMIVNFTLLDKLATIVTFVTTVTNVLPLQIVRSRTIGLVGDNVPRTAVDPQHPARCVIIA